MSRSKRARWSMWTGACVGVLALVAAIWTPFSRPSLEQSTIVVAPAPGVAPPAGKGDVLTIL